MTAVGRDEEKHPMSETSGWFRPCNFGDCAEVMETCDGVWVRSSRNPEAVAAFTVAEWQQFVTDVRAGRFDHASEGVCAHVKDRRLCPCVRFVDQPVREVADTPAAEPAPDREAVLAEAARVITYAIGDADVLDMQGDDLYRHFGQAVLDDLLERPDLLRALAGAGAPTEPADTQETTP